VSSTLLFLDQFGYLGGAQRVLLETLGSLDRSEYQPIVALGTDGEFRQRLLDGGISVLDLPLGEYHSGKKTFLDKVRFSFRSLYCTFVLARWVVRHRAKLLFANGPRTFACVTLTGVLTRRPVIWHLHNVFAAGVEPALLVWFARWVHTILVCSEAAAEPLLRRVPSLRSKVKLVYNPAPCFMPPSKAELDQLRESLDIRPDDVCVGIFGRITPFKGQLQFLQAARLVAAETRRARFFVVGSPAGDMVDREYYRQLLTLVNDAGMNGAVTFVEHQPEVEKYLGLMDVVAVTSQGPEALPQIIMEAMWLSKAVVATASGGIVEMLDGTTGLLGKMDSPTELAAAMLKLIRERDTRLSLGSNAQERISRQYSRQEFAKAIRLTLKECMGEEGR